MEDLYVIILAAGKGTRMKSKYHKVLHPLLGKPMIRYIIDHVSSLNPKKIITVVGHGAEDVMDYLGSESEYVYQAEQLGTGHAVKVASEQLGNQSGTTLVICGDTPLITTDTLKTLIQTHQTEQAKATILTAYQEQPYGYGRIVRDQHQHVCQIVEEKDATDMERNIKEINTGTYCFDNAELYRSLNQITTNNQQHEYYLTDIVDILYRSDQHVAAYMMEDVQESLGINDRVALAQATDWLLQKIRLKHMQQGVTLIQPDTIYIEPDVTIGQDTVIEPFVMLKGNSSIGEDCFIGTQSCIEDSTLEDHVVIKSSVLEKSYVKTYTDVGPMSRLRPGTELDEHVHIGNFVEIKNSKLGNATKVSHLTYVGDAVLGKDINVGCGTVFVNYDGKDKYPTHVGDHAFIGCNTNLIAPVTVGEGSFIAAGSTINKDVPSSTLAIARAKQENKVGYAKKMKHLLKDT